MNERGPSPGPAGPAAPPPQPPPWQPMTSAFPRWAAAASLVLFVAACVLPALLLKVVPNHPGPGPPSTEEMPGLILLVMGPLAAVFSGVIAWLANLAWVSALICLLLQKWRRAVFAAAAGFFIAFDTLRLASTPVLNGDSDSTLVLKQLLPGFYLWLASFVVIVACGLLGMRRQSRAATADNGADAPYAPTEGRAAPSVPDALRSGDAPTTPPGPPLPRSSRLEGGRWRGRVRQLAWASVPVWSLGALAFAPFLRLAFARRKAKDWGVFAAYLAAVAVEIVLISVTGSEGAGSAAAGGVAIALMGFAAVHAFIAFRPATDV